MLPILGDPAIPAPAFSGACAATTNKVPPPANTPCQSGLAAAIRIPGRTVVDARFRTIFTEPGGRIGFT